MSTNFDNSGQAEDTCDAQLCRRAAEKWLRAQRGRMFARDPDERRHAERCISAFLRRRGYGAADIHAALRAAREHDRGFS